MRESKIILLFTFIVFGLCGLVGWRLLVPEGGSRELSIPAGADLLSGVVENGRPNPTGRAVALSSRPAVSAASAADRTRVAYYERNTGRTLEVGLDGKSEKVLSSSRLPNFLFSLWSPLKKEVVSAFAGPGGRTLFSYYDFVSERSAPLASGIRAVAFAPSGKQIVYHHDEGNGEYGIYVAGPSGAVPKKITTTRIAELDLRWPREDLVVFSPAGEGDASNLFGLSLNGALSKIISDRPGLQTRWSQDGNQVLASSHDDVGVLGLAIFDLENKTERALPIGAGADECAWKDKTSIICRANEGGPDSGPGLYEINLSSNQARLIPGSEMVGRGVREIFTDPAGQFVIFVAEQDDRLHSLRIR